jgi:uncharacterized membrane protein YebE (DUF533 family)
MEIEQLKLILETLQGVGQEAGSLAALYLWLKFGATVLGHLFFAGGVAGIAYIVYRSIRMGIGAESSDQFFRDMRNQLHTGTPGNLTADERQRTIAALRQLAAKEKENT